MKHPLEPPIYLAPTITKCVLPLRNSLRFFGMQLQSRTSMRWLLSDAKSFQKEIHAVEVDDAMTVVQRIHPQNSAHSGAALPQGEVRQCSNAKFCWRRFEAANLKIVDLSRTDFPRGTRRKMCGDPCCLDRNSERLKESCVKKRKKCSSIDEQSCGLSTERTGHS